MQNSTDDRYITVDGQLKSILPKLLDEAFIEALNLCTQDKQDDMEDFEEDTDALDSEEHETDIDI